MRRRTFLGVGLVAVAPVAWTSMADAATPAKKRSPATAKKIGIAFGGGSIHGIAHLGVLKALAEKGVEIQFIAGTSAGAIVGALAAAKLPLDQMEAIIRRIEWPGVTSMAWSGKGLMQLTKLRAQIDAVLGARKIEQLPIAFAAIATDIATGERVMLRHGSISAAISASCSIPVKFEPVKINGRELVDGGLTEPVPVIAAREMGADIVIGVDVAFRPNEEPVSGLTGMLYQRMHIMGNALINEQIRHADLAIRMNLHPLIGKENSSGQLMAAGYAETLRLWPKLAALL